MEYEKTGVETTFASEEDTITVVEHLNLGVTYIMVNGEEFGGSHPNHLRLASLVTKILKENY